MKRSLFLAALLLLNMACSHDKKKAPESNSTAAVGVNAHKTADASSGQGDPSSELVGFWVEKNVAKKLSEPLEPQNPCKLLPFVADEKAMPNGISFGTIQIDKSGEMLTTADLRKGQPLNSERLGKIGSNGKVLLDDTIVDIENLGSYDYEILLNDAKELYSSKTIILKSGEIIEKPDSTMKTYYVKVAEEDMNKIYERALLCVNSL